MQSHSIRLAAVTEELRSQNLEPAINIEIVYHLCSCMLEAEWTFRNDRQVIWKYTDNFFYSPKNHNDHSKCSYAAALSGGNLIMQYSSSITSLKIRVFYLFEILQYCRAGKVRECIYFPNTRSGIALAILSHAIYWVLSYPIHHWRWLRVGRRISV